MEGLPEVGYPLGRSDGGRTQGGVPPSQGTPQKGYPPPAEPGWGTPPAWT